MRGATLYDSHRRATRSYPCRPPLSCRDYVLRSVLVVLRPCLVALLWTINRIPEKKKEEPRVRHSKTESRNPSSKAPGPRPYSLPVRTLHHGLNGFRKSQILDVRSCHQPVSRSHQHVIRLRFSSSLQHTSSHHIFLLQMGAQNRWDSIYKCEQAGTTKASATSPLTIRQRKQPTRNGDLHSCNGNETSAFFFFLVVCVRNSE